MSQYAQAGYLYGFADVGYVESLPTIPTIVDHEIRGNYMAFEVRGDSMDNGTKESLEEGEILICREVTKDLWQYKLHLHKWNFVIVHQTEGIVVKRITEHDVEKGLITIHSLNPFYPDRVLELKDISQIFNVVQIHRKGNL